MTQILIDICDNVDFRKPYFNNKVGMRNRSLGSAQALVVALALSDDAFVEKLRKLMDSNGKGFTLSMSYTDKFYI